LFEFTRDGACPFDQAELCFGQHVPTAHIGSVTCDKVAITAGPRAVAVAFNE
jgi:hypothetical protein